LEAPLPEVKRKAQIDLEEAEAAPRRRKVADIIFNAANTLHLSITTRPGYRNNAVYEEDMLREELEARGQDVSYVLAVLRLLESQGRVTKFDVNHWHFR
jgi:hypothetical protein